MYIYGETLIELKSSVMNWRALHLNYKTEMEFGSFLIELEIRQILLLTLRSGALYKNV